MNARHLFGVASLGGMLALAACSGGNSAGSLPAAGTSGRTQPSTNGSTAAPTSSPSTPSITQAFTITVPPASAAPAGKHRQYVSSNTGSVRIALQSVNGQASILSTLAVTSSATPGCVTSAAGLTCTIAAAAALGNDVFAISTYASSDGTGTILATATVSAVVSTTPASAIALTLAGVPSQLGFSPATLPLVNDGAIHRYPIVVNALDASGATIVGSSPYQSPVTLTIANDPTHALSLSTSVVEAPGTVVTVTFDGSRALSNAAIVASSTGMTTARLAAAPLTFSPGSFFEYDDQTGGAAVTTVQTGFSGTFTATLANASDGTATTLAGPLGSGSAVTTIIPSTTFDVTSLAVGNGTFTAQVPVTIAPHPGAYTTFGQPHVFLQPFGLVRAANGVLWTADAENGALVSLDPSSGTYTSYPVDPSDSGPTSLAFDAAGKLWFADGSQIGEFNTATDTFVDYTTGLGPNARVASIALGPSGTMAFYDEEGNNPPAFVGQPSSFGFISTATGAIAEYATPDNTTPNTASESMTLGPDGAEWFSDGTNGSIGRIDSAGNFAIYPIANPSSPNYTPELVLAAPDGNIWFAGANPGLVQGYYGTLNPASHAIALYATESAEFDALILGSDHNLWFAARPQAGTFFAAQDTIGVINVTTHAGYFYPAIVPEFAVIAGLVDPGNRTLYMLDNAYGQIGKVPFK